MKSLQEFVRSGVLLLLVLCSARPLTAKPTRLLAQPAVSERHVAFVYDRDLWIADRDGSNPRRLTSHEGVESSPRFSPDGKQVAFTGRYDGNQDVYVIPVEGGSPKRLTHTIRARTWSRDSPPDGKAVLFCLPTQHVYAAASQALHRFD